MNPNIMNHKERLEAAQAAKQQLCERIGDEPWCGGIGVAPDAHGGFALRVNVDSRQSDAAKLPDVFQGLPIVRVDMLPYKKRTNASPKAAKPIKPAPIKHSPQASPKPRKKKS